MSKRKRTTISCTVATKMLFDSWRKKTETTEFALKGLLLFATHPRYASSHSRSIYPAFSQEECQTILEIMQHNESDPPALSIKEIQAMIEKEK